MKGVRIQPLSGLWMVVGLVRAFHSRLFIVKPFGLSGKWDLFTPEIEFDEDCLG
jgi:hypothetical protein